MYTVLVTAGKILSVFSGVAYHTITSISSNSPIAPQMDAACQLLSIDKPFYADSVIPDL